MTLAWPEHLAGTSECFNDLANRAGVKYFDYQEAAVLQSLQLPEPLRQLLFYKTGAGKSITALTVVRLAGYQNVVVIAPPATHGQWEQAGLRFDMNVLCMSHAKFRQKNTKLSREIPVIADEFHLFGGHQGQGWKKLDTLAAHLQAPLVLASATPNYNDAERVYCIQHVLDPMSCRGGYLQFLYTHCNTVASPFKMEPDVDDVQPFRNFKDAAEYLAALPYVAYLPDDLQYQIMDISVPAHWPAEADTYGINRRTERIIASQIEERHARVNLALVDDSGKVRSDIYEILTDLVGAATTPSLVFAAHSTVADALGARLYENRVKHAVVKGTTPAKKKAAYIAAFNDGVLDVLVGTATLATGTDGMDKVCDQLIILDDTDDDALRRQLVGRIMPRGGDGDASSKQVYRILLTP
jgi:superfamily II DNA or RNA helicase